MCWLASSKHVHDCVIPTQGNNLLNLRSPDVASFQGSRSTTDGPTHVCLNPETITSFKLTCDPFAVHATLHHASQKWVCLSPHPLCRGPAWPESLLSLQMVRLKNEFKYIINNI